MVREQGFIDLLTQLCEAAGKYYKELKAEE